MTGSRASGSASSATARRIVHFQTWLRELRARGMILGVCSKNDELKALEPFREPRRHGAAGERHQLLHRQLGDKADNLRTLARRLNIGLDSVLFIDDSPFERNLVRELAPEVCVPEMPEDPADFVPYLESLNLFEATQFSERIASAPTTTAPTRSATPSSSSSTASATICQSRE